MVLVIVPIIVVVCVSSVVVLVIGVLGSMTIMSQTFNIGTVNVM